MIVSTKQFSDSIYAIDWSPNGKYIIAANYSAKVYLLDSESLKEFDSF